MSDSLRQLDRAGPAGGIVIERDSNLAEPIQPREPLLDPPEISRPTGHAHHVLQPVHRGGHGVDLAFDDGQNVDVVPEQVHAHETGTGIELVEESFAGDRSAFHVDQHALVVVDRPDHAPVPVAAAPGVDHLDRDSPALEVCDMVLC